MDIHTVDSDTFSVEDVVKAHMEDLAIQEQFGVTQLKYWVNVEARTLFCLMEGPTVEACNEVHKQSHGNTACNIIEVSDDEFNLFLGRGNHINDLAQTIAGEIDTGYRTILCITLLDLTKRDQHHAREAYRVIEQHEGVVILNPQEEIMASFIYASSAIQSALSISHYLDASSENVEYTIALSSGRPVDEKGNTLFETTKMKTHYLCLAGMKNTIHLDHETQLLAGKEKKSPAIPQHVKIIQLEDFKLLSGLFELFDKNLNAPDFKSKRLYAALGWSKSHVYRKLNSLTGMAPNQLIQEVRLRQSLQRIKRGDQTIAEVAYSSGFNSPTYFTKVFRKRFGILPGSLVKNHE